LFLCIEFLTARELAVEFTIEISAIELNTAADEKEGDPTVTQRCGNQ
jgi:hypothetical protein